jgi:hypothetical protein
MSPASAPPPHALALSSHAGAPPPHPPPHPLARAPRLYPPAAGKEKTGGSGGWGSGSGGLDLHLDSDLEGGDTAFVPLHVRDGVSLQSDLRHPLSVPEKSVRAPAPDDRYLRPSQPITARPAGFTQSMPRDSPNPTSVNTHTRETTIPSSSRGGGGGVNYDGVSRSEAGGSTRGGSLYGGGGDGDGEFSTEWGANMRISLGDISPLSSGLVGVSMSQPSSPTGNLAKTPGSLALGDEPAAAAKMSGGKSSLWKSFLPSSRRARRNSERVASQVAKGAQTHSDGEGGSLRGGKNFAPSASAGPAPPVAASAFNGWLAASYHSMSAVEAAQLKQDFKHRTAGQLKPSAHSTQSTLSAHATQSTQQSTQLQSSLSLSLGAMGTGEVVGMPAKSTNESAASLVSVSSIVSTLSPSSTPRHSYSSGGGGGGGGDGGPAHRGQTVGTGEGDVVNGSSFGYDGNNHHNSCSSAADAAAREVVGLYKLNPVDQPLNL